MLLTEENLVTKEKGLTDHLNEPDCPRVIKLIVGPDSLEQRTHGSEERHLVIFALYWRE